MEKIMNFIKSKSIAYFIVIGIAIYSLIVGIVFLSSYSNPSVVAMMGNRAPSLSVETIGIFLIGGFVVELVALLLPQYRFIQVAAVVMFGLAFYKDVIVIADFIAGIANNVMYNGGNVNFNMFIFISLIIILAASVACAFIGFYKDEAENAKDMKIEGGNVVKIAKVGGGGAVLVGAIVVSSVLAVAASARVSSFELITKAIKEAAEAYEYDYNPHDVLIKEKETWNFSDSELSKINEKDTREGHYMVYHFEGSYSEGWQGDYSPTYGHIYLWDDGLFGGRISSTNIKGYWYNSSIKDGHDEEGNDIADCLNMVSNIDRYQSIIANPSKGFYQYQAYAYCKMSWGDSRSIIMNGYHYYPEVAIAIDTQGVLPEFHAEEEVDISFWTPMRVLKDLSYSSIFVQTEVDWQIGDADLEVTNGDLKNDEGSKVGITRTTDDGVIAIEYVDGDKNRGISSIKAIFNEPGKNKITIKWGDFESSIDVKVLKALPKEDEDEE